MYVQRNRMQAGGTPALEQAHLQTFVVSIQQETQRRGRRLGGTSYGAKSEERRLCRFGRQMQAAQLGRRGLGQPGQHGADAIGFECALASPGRIAPLGAGDQKVG